MGEQAADKPPAAGVGEGPSLGQLHGSVPIPQQYGWFRRFLAVAGPGFLISVGYMDPGNWATDLAGGAKFGYTLIWVILASNLMAMLLQTLAVRLGIVTGRDLAQACRDYYCKPVAVVLWLLCEVAIIACDLAELIGTAVALQLLFGLPLIWGVLLTAFDTLLLLALTHWGFRKLEALILAFVTTIGLCFLGQVILARPDLAGVLHGTFVPQIPNAEAFYLAIGILGATVMPHNLYLHSALVQTRAFSADPAGRRQAIRLNTLDTIVSLSCAFLVNAAILVVAASVFHRVGDTEVTDLARAHEMLEPYLGSAMAALLFAVALLISGQSSTITGTLAGQVVMEGFVRIRLRPWVRRLTTRLLALIPAVLTVAGGGGHDTVGLLILSQVVLSLQLPFAVFPLLMFTSDGAKMGQFANPWPVKIVGYLIAWTIVALNVVLLYQQLGPWAVLAVAAIMGGFAAWVRWGWRPAHPESPIRETPHV